MTDVDEAAKLTLESVEEHGIASPQDSQRDKLLPLSIVAFVDCAEAA